MLNIHSLYIYIITIPVAIAVLAIAAVISLICIALIACICYTHKNQKEKNKVQTDSYEENLDTCVSSILLRKYRIHRKSIAFALLQFTYTILLASFHHTYTYCKLAMKKMQFAKINSKKTPKIKKKFRLILIKKTLYIG
jgi:hypothetical protein